MKNSYSSYGGFCFIKQSKRNSGRVKIEKWKLWFHLTQMIMFALPYINSWPTQLNTTCLLSATCQVETETWQNVSRYLNIRSAWKTHLLANISWMFRLRCKSLQEWEGSEDILFMRVKPKCRWIIISSGNIRSFTNDNGVTKGFFFFFLIGQSY